MIDDIAIYHLKLFYMCPGLIEIDVNFDDLDTFNEDCRMFIGMLAKCLFSYFSRFDLL